MCDRRELVFGRRGFARTRVYNDSQRIIANYNDHAGSYT